MQNRQNITVTCRELLTLPLLSESKLLAGDGGLLKTVRRINVMEVPDVIDWVQSGEFLMTTGYPFRDQPGIFVDLIRDLAAKGVVALGIKTKRFLQEIPNEVIDLANQLQFPLIELPPQTVFSEVIHEVMELVLDSEFHQLVLLQERMQSITGVLIEGGEVSEMLAELERQTGNPLLFVDSVTGVWASETDGFFTSEQSAQWMMESSQIDWKEGVHHIQLANRTMEVYVAQVDFQKDRRCKLVLFMYSKEITDLDRLTIDRTLPLLELELVNLEARKAVEFKYKDQFVQDWLFNRMESLADLRMRADACGFIFDEHTQYCVMLIVSRNHEPDLQFIRSQLKSWMEQHVYAIHFDQYVLLLVTHHKEHQSQMFTDLVQLMTSHDSYLCVGKVVSPERLNDSLMEAMKIEQISKVCHLEGTILRYEDLGIFPLLSVLPDSAEVRQFRERYVQPLIDFERSHNLNMIETLETYFECNQNMKLTATKLFTHYNTVVYRMDRIQSTLGVDLGKTETQLNLYLALKMLQLEKSRRQSFD